MGNYLIHLFGSIPLPRPPHKRLGQIPQWWRDMSLRGAKSFDSPVRFASQSGAGGVAQDGERTLRLGFASLRASTEQSRSTNEESRTTTKQSHTLRLLRPFGARNDHKFFHLSQSHKGEGIDLQSPSIQNYKEAFLYFH